MSALSSIGSSSQSLLIQQYQQQKLQGDPTNPNASTASDSAFAAAAQSLGLDSTQTAALQSQIKDAVQTALQNSDGSTDKRTTIQNAINETLKSDGIDPTKFQAALKAQFAKGATGARRHHHHPVNALSKSDQGTQTQPFGVPSATAKSTSSGAATQLLDTVA